MTLKELDELVNNYNNGNATIRIGDCWDMSLLSTSHTFVEVTAGGDLKVRNDYLGLYILTIYDIMSFKIKKVDDGIYRMYKEGRRA